MALPRDKQCVYVHLLSVTVLDPNAEEISIEILSQPLFLLSESYRPVQAKLCLK